MSELESLAAMPRTQVAILRTAYRAAHSRTRTAGPDALEAVVGRPGWQELVLRADGVILVVDEQTRATTDRTTGPDGAPEPAYGRWNARVRAALDAVRGCHVVVCRSPEVEACLATWPPTSDDPVPLGPSSEEEDPLGAWIDSLVGGSFRPLTVPPILHLSFAERALLSERDDLVREVDFLVDAVLTGAASSRPLGVAQPATVPGPRPIRYGPDVTSEVDLYRLWVESNNARWRAEAADLVAALMTRPTFSILVPVYRPEPDLLDLCIRSVLAQSYPHWEMCLFDDGSGQPETVEALQRASALDARVRVGFGVGNHGISAATNGAAQLATGTFLALLDQDDELDAEALAFVAAAIDQHPVADVLYTDEDKLDDHGFRLEPYFKPDWSPELLLSNMYVGHLLTIRRSLFESVGGFRSTHDGSQDYDLALRVTERAREVVHVPRLAYRWRKTAESTALEYGNKPQSDIAARLALSDSLERRGVDGWVESGMHEGTFRVRRRLSRPSVTVIIPFHDGAPLLDLCVRSLEATIEDVEWDVVLVDNRSWEPETFALVRQLTRGGRCRTIEYDAPFNWSEMNNLGAAETDAEFLLFLNSDIEARRSGWLEAMLEPAQDPEVGVVGAQLLYPDGRVQHAGVVLGLGAGVAWHPFCFLPPEQPGYFAQPRVMRNWSAVTGACMLVPRPLFERLDGFDIDLPTAFNDVDFCLRAHGAGSRVVYTPFAELIHHESASRGTSAMEVEESLEMIRRYGDLIRRDPFFNPNLDIHRQEYTVSVASEEGDPWIWIEWLAETSLNSSGRM